MNAKTRRARAKPTAEPTMDEVAQRDFTALVTEAQIEESEREYNSIWGMRRRVMLISLARSRDQLLEGFGSGDGPDTLLNMVEEINLYKDHLREGAEIADTAVSRLLCVVHAIIEMGHGHE
jgi:hypothetical protein